MRNFVFLSIHHIGTSLKNNQSRESAWSDGSEVAGVDGGWWWKEWNRLRCIVPDEF